MSRYLIYTKFSAKCKGIKIFAKKIRKAFGKTYKEKNCSRSWTFERWILFTAYWRTFTCFSIYCFFGFPKRHLKVSQRHSSIEVPSNIKKRQRNVFANTAFRWNGTKCFIVIACFKWVIVWLFGSVKLANGICLLPQLISFLSQKSTTLLVTNISHTSGQRYKAEYRMRAAVAKRLPLPFVYIMQWNMVA